ncbi:MAG: M20/M25/M40 family metallo-hydrolase [Candidatus Bipolaricaulota bacterium]
MIDPVRLAESLVRIQSVSGDEANLARELSNVLRTFCEIEQGPCGTVVGRIRSGDGPTLLLEGHMDTVPVGDADAWTRPPDGRVEDGVLWGRGAVDMKGAIAAQLAGAETASGAIRGTLLLVYVGHEETAEGVALGEALDTLPRPDLVILGEPTDLALALGHRGRTVLRLQARGAPAHASMPELGENAVTQLMGLLAQVMERPLPADPVLGPASLTPVAVGGGAAAPIVPDAAWALLDRRVVRGETVESVLSLYDGLPLSVEQTELSFHTGEARCGQQFFPAWWMSPKNTWAVQAREALDRPPYRAWRFSTDGVESCGRRGIPTVGFGPGDERAAHRVDEGVPTMAVSQAAEGYRRLLLSLMGPQAPPRSPARRPGGRRECGT